MNETCVRYDEAKKEVNICEYKSGRGLKWTGTPIYMIRCSCGYPLKAMFQGERPAMIQKCEFNSYNHTESSKTYRLHGGTQAGIAWSLQLDEASCPACEASISVGPNVLIAVEKFIRTHITDKNYKYNKNRVKVSPKAKQALERMVKFRSIQFMKECISGRSDFAIVWRTGNEKHDYSKGDWNAWYDRRNSEVTALKEAFGLNDEADNSDVDPFDFSDEVMNAHGDDCTCNLCQK